MELDQEEEELKREQTEKQAQEIAELQERLAVAEQKGEMNEEGHAIMRNLFDERVIGQDKNGKVHINPAALAKIKKAESGEGTMQ